MARPGYRKFHGFKSTVFGKNIPRKHLLDYAQARELAAEFTTLVEDGGIGLLIGEVGIGKTTAIRAFKEELGERSCRVCYVGSVKHSTAVLQDFVLQMGYQPSHQRANLLRHSRKRFPRPGSSNARRPYSFLMMPRLRKRVFWKICDFSAISTSTPKNR